MYVKPAQAEVTVLTASESAVGGELKGPLGAVPAVPRKLILALFNPTLSSCGYTAGVDQVGLKQCKPHQRIGDEMHTHYEVLTKTLGPFSLLFYHAQITYMCVVIVISKKQLLIYIINNILKSNQNVPWVYEIHFRLNIKSFKYIKYKSKCFSMVPHLCKILIH